MRLVAATLFALVLVGSSAAASSIAVPKLYDNCTSYNKKYPHGVGRAKAIDKTKSKSSKPVTTFARNTRLYNVAMKWNPDLDRDDDGIACEKR